MARQSRIVGRLGDVNWPEYDGALVFRTPHGHTLEWIEWYEDDRGKEKAAIGTYDVPGPKEWRGEWWARDLESIAHTTGEDVGELEASLDSRKVMDRASAIYYAVRGYTSLDHDELHLTKSEVRRRYGRSGPRKSRSKR